MSNNKTEESRKTKIAGAIPRDCAEYLENYQVYLARLLGTDDVSAGVALTRIIRDHKANFGIPAKGK